LRRAAKLDVRQNRKADAIAKFERAVTVDPEDPENRRSYGWALYNLGEPAKAKEQFAMVDELAGGADEDVAVGICLADAALGDLAAASTRYQRSSNSPLNGAIRITSRTSVAGPGKNSRNWSASAHSPPAKR